MKRMLINATHSEEIRVALADGQKLYNLDIDIPGQERKKGNIYKGIITRVEPSLEAAFVDYGSNRHGFLPYKEISRSYYTEAANKAKERPSIAKAVKEGTEVIIQVNKEERGNKGAAISTYISLAGRYLVYMPENPKAGGISRRIEGKARQDLKNVLSKVTQPKNSGVIVRTAGIGRTSEELDWDLNYLDQVWTAVKAAAANRKAPAFLYQESDIAIRALRDYLRPDVGEILIDDKEIYEKTRDFMQQVMPHNLKKLSFYNDTTPLFSRYQIEGQIQSAFSREVRLPSGGSIVIDHTEAMISIDINSARATKGADIEETATNTNLEAADEIARQLRIRDLGGLVVIDFIDMRNHKNQRAVEQQLNEAVENDRARIQTSKISRFGLLEMSRQRLRSSINETSQFVCPRCSGHGFIRNIESLSVSILRIMEEEAQKPGTGKVIAQVPTKVANFIINDKREELNSLESRHAVPMYIIANEFYQSPQFDIQRLKKSEADDFDIKAVSLNKPENEEAAENQSSQATVVNHPKAVVDVLVPEAQAPVRDEKATGFSGWLKSLFTSNSPAKAQTKPKKTTAKNNQQHKNKSHSHKKPLHTKQNKTQNKPQNKNSSATNKQTNKKTNANPYNRNRKKPNPQKQGQAKTGPKPTQKQQAAKPKQHVQKMQKPKQAAPANKQAAKPSDSSAPNEQILQRPLGSVASYAANKDKQAPPVTDKNTIKQETTAAQNKQQSSKTKASNPVNKTKTVTAKPQNKAAVEKTQAAPSSISKPVKSDKKTTITKETVEKSVKTSPKKPEKETITKDVTPIKKTTEQEDAKTKTATEAKTQTAKTSNSESKPVAKETKLPKKEESKKVSVEKTKTEAKVTKEKLAETQKKTQKKPQPSDTTKDKTQVPKETSKAKLNNEEENKQKPVKKTTAKKAPQDAAEAKKPVKKTSKKVAAKKSEPAAKKTSTEKEQIKPKKTSQSKENKESKVEKTAPKKTVKPLKKIPNPTDGINFDI